MCQLHLGRIARLNDMIAKLDAQVEAMMALSARSRTCWPRSPGPAQQPARSA